MKYYLGILFFICVLMFSCKKEEPIPPAPNVPPIDGAASYASGHYGVLQLYQVNEVTAADTLAVVGYLNPLASFSQAPMNYLQNASVATVDSLFFNTTKMTYDGSYYYEDNSFTQYVAPYTWQVYGNSVIPSFTYTNPNSLPSYTGCAILPDSMKLGKVLNFNLTGLSGQSKVACFLSDGNGGFVFKEFLSSNSTIPVSFSESETAGMTASGSMVIGIWIIKDNARYFGGKSFNFTTELLISKPLYVQ